MGSGHKVSNRPSYYIPLLMLNSMKARRMLLSTRSQCCQSRYFSFNCWLTPQEYTLTVATQHPDGHSHDWLDDVITFRVLDTRRRARTTRLSGTQSGGAKSSARRSGSDTISWKSSPSVKASPSVKGGSNARDSLPRPGPARGRGRTGSDLPG